MPCITSKIEHPSKKTDMPKQINIMFIPIGCMRPQYRDGYDYWVDERGILQIRIAEFENPDFTLYWAIHELLEFWRCTKKGVTLKAIEDFDAIAFAKGIDDPGSEPDAPYRKEHMQSLLIQDILCMQDRYDEDDFYAANPIGYDPNWVEKERLPKTP